MGKEFSRTRRVAELLQRELAVLISAELNDPRLGMVTVTAVQVSKDYSNATVFVTRLGDSGSMESTISALNRAAGFLRKALCQRLDLRSTPKLHFRFDSSIEKGSRLYEKLDRLSFDNGDPER